MTWSEIKKAVEDAGVEDSDDICNIQCEIHHGNKTLHQVRLGRFLRLVEDPSESARIEASGCTV